MLSSVPVDEKQNRVESNPSEYLADDQLNSQNENGVVEAELWPNQTFTMEDDGGIGNSNDDEFSSAFALQPIRDRLQEMPLSNLDEKCMRIIGKKLDIERPVGLGGNYLDLASRLFPEKSNDSLKSDLRIRKCPTSHILKNYCKEKGQQATVVKMIEALFKMRRLDVIQDILNALENRGKQDDKKRNFKASNLLTILRKRTIRDPDTVSGLSVHTTTLSESYDTSEEASFHVVHGGYQPPLKQNYLAKDNSFSSNQDKSGQQGSSDNVFVVSASDEVRLCVNLVHWLRKKGFDASCVEVGQLECVSHPFQYVNSLLQKAGNIIVVCSPKYKEVVSDENSSALNIHDLAIRTVYFAMCHDFFESGGNCKKYIPLLKSPEFRSSVVYPMSWTMATVFKPDDKERRDALLRRLCKVERYTLGPIGSKPKIRPKLITGHLSDLRK